MSKFEFQIRFDAPAGGNLFSPAAIRMIVEQLPETVVTDGDDDTSLGIVDVAELEGENSIRVVASLPDRFADRSSDYPSSKVLYEVVKFETRGAKKFITEVKVRSITLS